MPLAVTQGEGHRGLLGSPSQRVLFPPTVARIVPVDGRRLGVPRSCLSVPVPDPALGKVPFSLESLKDGPYDSLRVGRGGERSEVTRDSCSALRQGQSVTPVTRQSAAKARDQTPRSLISIASCQTCPEWSHPNQVLRRSTWAPAPVMEKETGHDCVFTY
ncbi:hypothetical protein DPEC_G00152230 [Dallia pectoralis]|uniref:Uncharacterized protein n=1 Tax=Dallia pectoralis TaxID=75939 RepID=A0ACC2GJM3_DALPE|nr:hypothetical protein DPEC_G00152230 [Dallia pectoralis]